MNKIVLLIYLGVSFSYGQVIDLSNDLAVDKNIKPLAGSIGVGGTPSGNYALEVFGEGWFERPITISPKNPVDAHSILRKDSYRMFKSSTNFKTVDLDGGNASLSLQSLGSPLRNEISGGTYRMYNADKTTVAIDGNYKGGGQFALYAADTNYKAYLAFFNRPDDKQTGFYITQHTLDGSYQEAFKMNSVIFTGDTEPTNFFHLPSTRSTIVIAGFGDYKKGQGYGLINKLKTSFEGDVHMPVGNMSIGFTPSATTQDAGSYKLSVNGFVRATEVKVYTNWADFVFEKNYNLPTLKEVESYIVENGHLKDIPSTKEVQENGVQLGEMNKLLLQKIEELTLYTIQMKKDFDDLKLKVENMATPVGCH